ncbi:membrane-spanning 4-domains subfamily A member 4D-like isoform X3 [Gadus macrocephalus]|uniref:membrane-spanning 4-domains subfamily A member 4D-like isoform X3 n=1 Tax=Gadus macrocephalus TaxID=80720 RepID=UPI0028CB41C9|nr:membrane-spanning 4-domains subfamily A member 4D-like isoform X3 [Gadus macrocephalus]
MSGSLDLRMESGEREQLASPQNEPTASEGLGKFQRLKPTILGAIEVTIGISMALTAIAYLAVDVDPYLTAILFWGILIYIPAGGLTIAADWKPTRAKVCAALGMNVLVALSAVAGSPLHGFAIVIFGFEECVTLCHSEFVMLAASILLFIISIIVVASAVSALCASRKPSKEHTVI